MRTVLLLMSVLLTSIATAADVPLPEGAKLRIGDPNGLRAVSNFFAFSPDGNWLFVKESARSLRLWNLKDGTRGKKIAGLNPYYYAAVSPDGKWIAYHYQRNVIELWNTATVSNDHNWSLDRGAFGYMQFTADSKFLLGLHYSNGFDQAAELMIWNMTTYKLERSFPVGTGRVMVISPDGRHLAHCHTDNKQNFVRVYNLATGKIECSFKVSEDPSQCLAFKGNNKLLTKFANKLYEFDLAKPDAKPVVTTYPNRIEALSPDGSRLALSTALFDQIRIWDVATNKPLTKIDLKHVRARSFPYFSPDSKSIVCTLSQFERPYVWDAATGEERFANKGHPVPVTSLAVIEDGKTLASCADDHVLRFWDLRTGVQKKPFDLTASYLQLCADGHRMLAGHSVDRNSWCRVYETSPLKQLGEFSDEGPCAVLSPDGKRVGFCSEHAVSVYGVDEDQLIDFCDEGVKLESRQALAFAADSKQLIGQSKPGHMMIGIQSKKRTKPKFHIYCNEFFPSPDAQLFAYTGGYPDHIIVVNMATGKEVTHFKAKKHQCITWSRDGKWIGTADRTKLFIWSATTGKLRLARGGHADEIQAIAFTPDGKSVITGGKDNLVYVWDLPPVP